MLYDSMHRKFKNKQSGSMRIVVRVTIVWYGRLLIERHMKGQAGVLAVHECVCLVDVIRDVVLLL